MGNIADGFSNAWRDFNTDGVPSSGDYEVVKKSVRDLGPVIESSIANTVAPYVNAAAASAQQASAVAASVGTLGTYPTALPYRVLGIGGGVGTGVGGTPGTYALAVTGGPAGHEAYGVVGGDGKVAGYTNERSGLATTNTAPTYAWPAAAGFTTAPTAPTASVGNILAGETFFSPSADGTQRLTWQNTAGALAPFLSGGVQEAVYYKNGIDQALSNVSGAGVFAALFVKPGYIGTNGDYTAGAHWISTELIPLAYFKSLQIKLYGDTSRASVAFYTRDEVFISGAIAANNGDYITAMPTIPATAFYVRFTANSDLIANQIFAWELQPGELPDPLIDAGLVTGNLYAAARRRGFMSSANPPVFTDSGNWLCTGFIAVRPGYTLTYNVGQSNGMMVVAFYDATRTYLPTSSVAGTGSSVNNAVGIVTVPATAAYVRISFANPGSTAGAAAAAYGNTVFYAPAAGAGLTLPSTAEIPLGNIAIYSAAVGYITNTGTDSAFGQNWCRTAPFGVRPGRYITFDAAGQSVVNFVSFYDSTGAYLSGVAGVGSGGPIIRTTSAVLVPANAVTARICYGNIDWANNTLGAGGANWNAANTYFVSTFRYVASLPRNGAVIAATDTVVLYGDSRMSNAYTFNAAAWANRLGCTVLNKGLSGHTVQQNASDADLASVYASTNPRLVVFLPGGNDTGAAGTIGTFSASSPNGAGGESVVTPLALATATPSGATFIQYVDLAVQKIIAQYGNIRSRAGVVSGDTPAQKTAKLALIQKTLIMLITDLPQQSSVSAAFSVPANWERKRQAILEVAAYRKVLVSDFQGAYPINMALEPTYSTPADTVNNNGNLYMDGLHPNEVGHQLIADYAIGRHGLN